MVNLREIPENIKVYGEFNGVVKENEPLAEHSTFKIGGTARIFIEPKDEDSLAVCIKACAGNRFVVVGGGSNVLFPDGEFETPVISLAALDSISHYQKDGRIIISCGAGVQMKTAIEFSFSCGAHGLERFAGLPGTVGGAAFMNARCYDVSLSDVFWSARFFRDGAFAEYAFSADDWEYKKSPFQKGGILEGAVITQVSFALREATGDEARAAKQTAERCIADREQKGHFLFPSAGSVFKNNRAFGKTSGQLIDEAGLKGFRAGGAQIAPWHGNIIVNTGGAASGDVRSLIDRAASLVQERFGFCLETEIVILARDFTDN